MGPFFSKYEDALPSLNRRKNAPVLRLKPDTPERVDIGIATELHRLAAASQTAPWWTATCQLLRPRHAQPALPGQQPARGLFQNPLAKWTVITIAAEFAVRKSAPKVHGGSTGHQIYPDDKNLKISNHCRRIPPTVLNKPNPKHQSSTPAPAHSVSHQPDLAAYPQGATGLIGAGVMTLSLGAVLGV